MSDFDEYYEATEPELRERAFGWATAIGLQQVDGLSPSKYLIQTDVGEKPGGDVVNDVVNGVVSFSVMEERAVKLLLKDSRLSAARLAEALGVKQRQAQRIIASLKAKAGLKRRGSDKTGEWYFETLAREG